MTNRRQLDRWIVEDVTAADLREGDIVWLVVPETFGQVTLVRVEDGTVNRYQPAGHITLKFDSAPHLYTYEPTQPVARFVCSADCYLRNPEAH